eukprot:CAMPEP_0119002488 /NCGR_PEP_ID=MMETSP1173-20130426/65107_1 /TAXON_ID=1034831 /ORGANISM="Rhizochromulina marina cf, Strain CCMP1243" /LENGTH=62 /DNA_ID=CAMNT_0006953995 /DNA_START=505 /DNA_END=689 /DNA_ORIENTATION=+
MKAWAHTTRRAEAGSVGNQLGGSGQAVRFLARTAAASFGYGNMKEGESKRTSCSPKKSWDES